MAHSRYKIKKGSMNRLRISWGVVECDLGPQGPTCTPGHKVVLRYGVRRQGKMDSRLRVEEARFRLADYSGGSRLVSLRPRGPIEGKKPHFLLSPGSWGLH